MPISFACSNCGKRYSVKDEMAGKTAKCGCGQQLQVPLPQSGLDSLLDDLGPLAQNAPAAYSAPVNSSAHSAPPTPRKKLSREESAANIRRNLARWWKTLAALTAGWLVMTLVGSFGAVYYGFKHHYGPKQLEALGTTCGIVASIVLGVIWFTAIFLANRTRSR